MTQRGERTRAKLIEATLDVVADVGYARASTRAIAQAAGVAEGTIYRHFPDKTSLFFAAALTPHASVLEFVAGLPAKVGTATVAHNLTEALCRLAELYDLVFPLEIAIQADPELSAMRRAALVTDGPMPGGPPAALASYLSAEQGLGRVRAEVVPQDAALVLLAVLFGLAMTAAKPGRIEAERIRATVGLLTGGISGP